MLIDELETWNHNPKHLIQEAAEEVETNLSGIAPASFKLRSWHLRQRAMLKCWTKRGLFKHLYTKQLY